MRKFLLIACLIAVATAAVWIAQQGRPQDWTAQEVATLKSLWIGSLPPPPTNPSNAVADNPLAARFGYELFFDTRLSANGAISCASCHQPERFFTDGLPTGQGLGQSDRNTMTVVGAAYSPWQFWDGRKDSLWSQALAPLESPIEHGTDRRQIARLVATDERYRRQYETLFGKTSALNSFEKDTDWADADIDTDEIFVNIGKSIAAYERLLRHGESRFDRYVRLLLDGAAPPDAVMSNEEIAGLRLFIGDAGCINCHNGPLLTNNEFHNTAILPPAGEVPSLGRVSAVRAAREDPFNCLGQFSDDAARNCAELRFTRTGDELIGTHKTPSLRNVADTGPYMHAGQMATLAGILDQYNRAPLSLIGHNEAKPLKLSKRELGQLEVFLHTLSGPLATEARWLTRPGDEIYRSSSAASASPNLR